MRMLKSIVIASLSLILINTDIANATYYVWGPEELEPAWEVLNAVAQLMGSSIYVSALRAFLVLGLIILALYFLGSPRLGIIAIYIGVIFTIYIALYGPKTTVHIHDLTCDGWRTPINCDRTVANTPAVLAILLDIVGAVNKLAEHIGVTYGSISGGFPSKVRCTEALTSLTFNRLRDTQVREDFITYVTNCLVPCSYLQPSLWATIADSENLLSALNLPAECSFLEVYDGSIGNNVLCTSFYASKIQPVLSGTVGSYLDPDWYDKVVTRFCAKSLSSSHTYGGKNNLDPESIARQAILTDGLIVSLQLAGGVSENLKARMLLTNQKQTTRAVLKAMSQWLRDVFPMIKAVAQIFGVAFFPFALMLALLPQASRGLFFYFGALLAIAFLSPAMAIANAVVNWFGEWQTSVLTYAPAAIYELRNKLWLSGAVGAVSFALIQVFLGFFMGGVVAGIWRGIFSAGSPVHLPETARRQAADPLGVQKASAELAQRAEYERRGELVSAGMFSGVYEAQKNLSFAQRSIALGMTGVTAGAYMGVQQAYKTAWQGSLFTKAGEWINKNLADLTKYGFSPVITDSGMIAIRDKTGEMVATVNPMTEMVSLTKPDLALSATLSKEQQRVISAIKEKSFRGAFSIAWNKAFGYDTSWGINKMTQDLEAYSHTRAGANYRQFVSRIANETKSDEQDVHRAVSILTAIAGPEGTLTLKEAQNAINKAARMGPSVVRAMAGILSKLGFSVGVRLQGRGTSESEHSFNYTVSSSKGDSYSVNWSKSDEWKMLTQTTASVARRYGENWTDSERKSFDKNMGVVDALSSREGISETLGLSTGVDLQRDIDKWAREKYGYGEYLRMLNTHEGRRKLLEEYIVDKLQGQLSSFNLATMKERKLQGMGVDIGLVYKAWREFQESGKTDAFTRLGLSEPQVRHIRAIREERGEKEAYLAMLDYLLENNSVRPEVEQKVPMEIPQPPRSLGGVENLSVEGISEEEVQRNIGNVGREVSDGKESLSLPSPNKARKGVSFREALSNVPHQAITTGLALGLLSLAAEKGLEWFANKLGKNNSGQNILDEIFSKEEQEKLRELRERARKGDTKAAQEYLERWQKRMSELEKTDPLRYQRIQKALEGIENIMEDRGMLGRVRQVASELIEKAPQFAKRLGNVLGGVAKVLGVADLLINTSPAHAPTLERRTPHGTFHKGVLWAHGIEINEEGNLQFMENLTPKQIENLKALGITPRPGKVLEGRDLEIMQRNFAQEYKPLFLSKDEITSLVQNGEWLFKVQETKPIIVDGRRVLVDNEGYIYDYQAMRDAGLTINDEGNVTVANDITLEQTRKLLSLDISPAPGLSLNEEQKNVVRQEFGLRKG